MKGLVGLVGRLTYSRRFTDITSTVAHHMAHVQSEWVTEGLMSHSD